MDVNIPLSAGQDDPSPPASSHVRTANWLYPATTFLSAGLLFVLQPLFAKMLTPLMGGSPAVWNTALVFYQGALLLGYLYAHLVATRLSPRVQLVVHACVLGLGLAFLPIQISKWIGAPDVGNAVGWTLAALAASLGGPIVAVSATAPLLQAWRARLGDGVDPYRLYAASNLGSFSALAAFPFLIEPFLGAKTQALVWSVGYVGLAFALIYAVWIVPKGMSSATQATARASTWTERLKWMFFAAPPSALLVGVTTHLTTDVASVPLLWLPPLALFLLTFVIAFSPTGERLAVIGPRIKLIMVLFLAGIMAANVPFLNTGLSGLCFHLFFFFVIVLGCHVYLADIRPEPARLTEFYLWMSFGGVVGGACAALLAPVVLNGTYEYQIALAASLAIAPMVKVDWRTALRTFGLVLLTTLVLLRFQEFALWMDAHMPLKGLFGDPEQSLWRGMISDEAQATIKGLYCVSLALIALTTPRAPLLGVIIGGLALLVPPLQTADLGVKFRERSFFGVLKVWETGSSPADWRFLSHGTTLHGVMSLDPARNREPMSYYYIKTPIGTLFNEATTQKPETLVAGVIGMGMGSTLCYAKPGQSWTVFEIDDDVIKAATNPNLIGFINRCAPDATIVRGDARLTMRTQPDAKFDILLVDAFSSDAIPTHMITKEALGEFMTKMKPDGVLVVHISNRYLNLGPIVADAAHELGISVMEGARDGDITNPNVDTGVRAMVLSKSPQRLARYQGQAMWTIQKPGNKTYPWTDDHTNILRALKSQ